MKENVKFQVSFRAYASLFLQLHSKRTSTAGTSIRFLVGCLTLGVHIRSSSRHVQTSGATHFTVSGVCMIHCLEGESDPHESEGFSAESLAVVPRQRLQIGGLWARFCLQMARCGSVFSSCSVFLKNVN